MFDNEDLSPAELAAVREAINQGKVLVTSRKPLPGLGVGTLVEIGTTRRAFFAEDRRYQGQPALPVSAEEWASLLAKVPVEALDRPCVIVRWHPCPAFPTGCYMPVGYGEFDVVSPADNPPLN